MFDADCIRDAQARMERARASHDRLWSEIASLVHPEFQNFSGWSDAGSRFMRDQLPAVVGHDPYTAMALQDGVSVFESYVVPRGQRWQGLELADEGLMADVEVLQWLEKAERRLFAMRNHPESGFVTAIHDSATSLFAYAPQAMWVDDRWDAYGRWAGIAYESLPVFDVWWEYAGATVMRMHRKMVLTAEAALAKWGEEAPAEIRKAMDGPNPNRQAQFTIIHAIWRNMQPAPGRIDRAGKPWHGCYCLTTDYQPFAAGAYRSQPMLVSSFNRPGNLTYGRSPSMMALAEIRKKMDIERDRELGAELSLLPPILTAPDALSESVLELHALGVTEGGLDERGNPLIQQMTNRADASDARELTAEKKELIDRIFYRQLLQLGREYKTHITAARTEEEKAEKGVLLAPLARQEGEWLSPMTARELEIMGHRGMFDDMPPKVAEYLNGPGLLGLRYDNGLSRLQEASKSVAYLTLAQQVAVLAQFDPQAAEDFKREYPPSRVIPELGRIAGVPAAMRATDAERAAYDQAKQQQANLQQLLAAAPALAGAAKDANAAFAPQGGGLPA